MNVLTDEEIDAVTDKQWDGIRGREIAAAHRAYARAIEAEVIRKLAAGVSVEPVASDNPDFMTIPVEYQYAYPDGTWRCSNGDAINGMKPTAARALYARKDSQ